MLTLISLAPFCISVLKHIAVCNIAELMLCCCFLTVCISGSSFVYIFYQFYNLYCAGFFYLLQAPFSLFSENIQAIYICLQVKLVIDGEQFPRFPVQVCSPSWCQLISPKLYRSTDTANDRIVFFALNSVSY